MDAVSILTESPNPNNYWNYHRKGYSDHWINQRLKSIEVRKELTDEWERSGVKKGQEYAILTDVITIEGFLPVFQVFFNEFLILPVHEIVKNEDVFCFSRSFQRPNIRYATTFENVKHR